MAESVSSVTPIEQMMLGKAPRPGQQGTVKREPFIYYPDSQIAGVMTGPRFCPVAGYTLAIPRLPTFINGNGMLPGGVLTDCPIKISFQSSGAATTDVVSGSGAAGGNFVPMWPGTDIVVPGGFDGFWYVCDPNVYATIGFVIGREKDNRYRDLGIKEQVAVVGTAALVGTYEPVNAAGPAWTWVNGLLLAPIAGSVIASWDVSSSGDFEVVAEAGTAEWAAGGIVLRLELITISGLVLEKYWPGLVASGQVQGRRIETGRMRLDSGQRIRIVNGDTANGNGTSGAGYRYYGAIGYRKVA